MAASLWSKYLGLSALAAARACRSAPRASGLHALRAGRLSTLRLASTAANPVRAPAQDIAPAELEEYCLEDEADVSTNPNADQPKFSTLEDAVSSRTLKALTSGPFNLEHMSPVQAAVLPRLPGLVETSENKSRPDLLVKARTGTGKTLAFLIPAVEARLKAIRAHEEKVSQDTMNNDKALLRRAAARFAKTSVGTLIISPTRELATQIANEAIKLTSHHARGEGFEVRLFVGGLPKRAQLREWHTGRRDIVVATPGRLRDCMENEPGFSEDLHTADMFILDEADTLLEMGFREDIQAITDVLKPASERQTFMFSATLAKNIQQVARTTLSADHEYINCVPDNAAPTHLSIPQYYTAVPSPEEQLPHILRLIAEDQLANPDKSKVLVFLPTTRMVKLYHDYISEIGKQVLPAGQYTRFAEMHSKKSMESRVKISDWYRRQTHGSSVMLTSDISARGVDYPGVTRVIQVGTPANADAYVHRVGRTGRGSNMKGRADLVLQSWEAGFLSWQLTDIPIKELTTNQLKEQVTSLAEKYDADPSAFFSNSRFAYSQGVAARVTEESMKEKLQAFQTRADPEEVHDAIVSMLAFYAANGGSLRISKEATTAGVNKWAEGLTGTPMRIRVPRDWVNSRPARPAGRDRGHSRSSSYSRDRDSSSWDRNPDQRRPRRDTPRDFGGRDQDSQKPWWERGGSDFGSGQSRESGRSREFGQSREFRRSRESGQSREFGRSRDARDRGFHEE